MRTFESVPIEIPIPRSRDPLHRREAVAEVRLCRGADADPSPSLGDQVELDIARVCSVHDRGSRAEATRLRKQLDGSDAVLGDALLDLAGLLVGVDVEHEAFRRRVAPDLLEPVPRARPDGVGGDADLDPGLAQALDFVEVCGHGFLAKAGDASAAVGDVEEDEVDVDLVRRFGGCKPLGDPDVVKLPDRGESRSEHLAVGLSVLRSNSVGSEPARLYEHRVAPRPEVAALDPTSHRPLERMAVGVDETGQRQTLDHAARLAGAEKPPGRGETILDFVDRSATPSVAPPLSQLPNALTVARFALIPLFVVLVLRSDEGHSVAAAIVFAVAGITDQIDGFLARRWHVESDFGKLADPLADRLMIDAAIVLLWIEGRLPWPALAIILLRDVILVGGSRFAVKRGYTFEVSFLGKAATWLLYASIVGILATPAGTDWPLVLFWIGVGGAVLAGLDYVVKVWRVVR